MTVLKISAYAILLAGMLASCSNMNSNVPLTNASNANTAVPAPTAQPAPPEEATLDPKKLYSKNCATCHRETGVGGKMEFEGKKINPDNLTSDKAKRLSDEKIANTIREGVEDDGMPAFKDKLKDDQIKAIISYIRSDLQKIPVS